MSQNKSDKKTISSQLYQVYNLEVLEHFVIENHTQIMIFYDKMFQYFQIVYH